MAITIDFDPDLEKRVREVAARQGQDVAMYVRSVVEEKLRLEPALPFYARASKIEWLQAFNAWLDSHDPNLPPLSDEALSRESIYGDRGL